MWCLREKLHNMKQDMGGTGHRVRSQAQGAGQTMPVHPHLLLWLQSQEQLHGHSGYGGPREGASRSGDKDARPDHLS